MRGRDEPMKICILFPANNRAASFSGRSEGLRSGGSLYTSTRPDRESLICKSHTKTEGSVYCSLARIELEPEARHVLMTGAMLKAKHYFDRLGRQRVEQQGSFRFRLRNDEHERRWRGSRQEEVRPRRSVLRCVRLRTKRATLQ